MKFFQEYKSVTLNRLVRLFVFLIINLAEISAQQKGVTPNLKGNVQQSITKNTFAVVVGISDYQDPGIPDLRFADRDAEAFADFLRSTAGVSMDSDHLKVLTNKNATAGRIAEAMDGLIELAKEGDQVIIYFSGHGDVEGKKISQPGFLLCWDSPSRVYMGGGTYSLAYLQEVISTLSLQNKAKVIVVTDACHAGKLAGSQIGGAQFTAANLVKQFANEIKILSCQPGEYSLEGEQWGGGRGIFSYHLVDGMSGLADKNGDGMVSLGELDRYLEDHVTAEAAPQSQVPLLVGNKSEQLSRVNNAILAELKKLKAGGLPVFKATEGRGLEDDILAKVDSLIREKYLAFKRAVAEKHFFPLPTDTGKYATVCADVVYNQISNEQSLAPLRGMMKRNYAAALQDEAQQTLNDLLYKGVDKILTSAEFNGISYISYPRMLGRAAELLGSENYFYKSLLGRKSLFESFLTKDKSDAMKKCRESLEYIPDFPLAFWRMAYIQRWNYYRIDSSLFFCKKAMGAAPSWPRPVIDYALYCNNPDTAQVYLNQAYQMDSTSAVYWYSLGLIYNEQNNKVAAAKSYEKAVTAATHDGLCFPCTYVNLSSIYIHQGDTLRALQNIYEGLKKDSLHSGLLVNLSAILEARGNYDSAEFILNKALTVDPDYMDLWSNLTHLYTLNKKYHEGLIACQSALQACRRNVRKYQRYTFVNIYQNYADILSGSGRQEEAFEYYCQSIIEFVIAGKSDTAERIFNQLSPNKKESIFNKFEKLEDSLNANDWIYLALFTDKHGQSQIALKMNLKAIALNPESSTAWNNLGLIQMNSGQLLEAEKSMINATGLDSLSITAWSNLGMLEMYLGHLTDAEKSLRKALFIDSTSYIAWNTLGLTQSDAGQFLEAEKSLRKAISIEPKFSTGWSNLGFVQIQIEHWEDAYHSLHNAIVLDTAFANPRKHLGMVCFKTGRLNEGRQNFLKALELKPDYSGAMLGMAYIAIAEKNMLKHSYGLRRP